MPSKEYEVEKVVDEKLDRHGKVKLYRIRWLNYSARSDTWEPPENLSGCAEILAEWDQKKRKIQLEKLEKTATHKKGFKSPPRPKLKQHPLPLRKEARSDNTTSDLKSKRLSKPSVSTARKRASSLSSNQEKRHRPETNLRYIKNDNSDKEKETTSEPSDTKKDISDTLNEPFTQPLHTTSNFTVTNQVGPVRQNAYSYLSFYEKKELFRERLRNLEGPEITLVNEVDDEPCPSLYFQFITTYRLTEGVVPPDPNFQSGCTCSADGCNLNDPSRCECLDDLEEPKQFAYDAQGRVRRDAPAVIYECNSFCCCPLSCPNRVVQRGRTLPLEIFKTKGKGWGVRSLRFIPSGTFITCYLGEVITSEEAAKRDKNYDQDGITYLFDLDMFEDSSVYTVDAQTYGDVSRFFNHSCSPNLAIYSVIRNHGFRTIYDLAFFAIKDIKPLEELTFDYAGVRDNSSQSSQQSQQMRSSKIRRKCKCGATNCRGWLFG
ncbi:histone H3 methyltransferase Clr4 [Schizosaccharomyces cryophilus OY26]|uniref:Histone-lysine N-methyltransferase n=1 Tax=Schizosaccharomyces cryophilus (strain OY26 / ATCC MYA-4695 / CBS 11777 / NBRC 106824 / NRRL Y48691) TaxID=653667 RepID=S9VZ58_SCHCR|nr:histone H3 methyltransferase Clr4 [Schizosaccharomyces cryophilus OY26]EPY51100.1 histone H3 methyltransferase Clr4 [Schizosaccharomyces cryophilus OY26]